jgi:uncharacterized Zn finger protein
MPGYDGGWAPYVSVAERQLKAQRAVAKLRKGGSRITPVTIEGRLIASTVWGRAWCQNLERYGDYESRLPKGRSYVRNGSVVDLQIAAGRVTALVSGSELYRVTITVKETAKMLWKRICTDCAGGIDTLIEVLQGRLSTTVMNRICRQADGLFPKPSDIHFSCSCPDYAFMCKHIAAVLYGVGARLDHGPELLFRLRGVDERDLVTLVEMGPAPVKNRPDKILQNDDMAALFGLDLGDTTTEAVLRKGRPLSKKRVAVTQPQRSGFNSPTARTIPDQAARGSTSRGVADNVARKAGATKKDAKPRKVSPDPGEEAIDLRARSIRTARAKPLVAPGISAKESLATPKTPSIVQKRVTEGRGGSAALLAVNDAGNAPKSRRGRSAKGVPEAKEPQPVKWWLKSYRSGQKR